MTTVVKKEAKKELVNTNVFVFNTITYVPHYTKKNVYVGPGYGLTNNFEYSVKDLSVAGALLYEKPLWERSWALK